MSYYSFIVLYSYYNNTNQIIIPFSNIDPDYYQAELPDYITPETQEPDHDFHGKN